VYAGTNNANFDGTTVRSQGAEDFSGIRAGDVVTVPQQAPPSFNATVLSADDVNNTIAIDRWIVAGSGEPSNPPANNQKFQVYEITSLPTASQIPNTAWISFNDTTGLWNAQILERENTDPPQGEISDTVPDIRFKPVGSSNSDLLPFSAFDVFSFFGRELTINDAQTRYQDLLKRKETALASVDRTDIKVGDIVLSPRLSQSSGLSGGTLYLVKRASLDVLKEETELKLLRM
jgi:hypothetical protein